MTFTSLARGTSTKLVISRCSLTGDERRVGDVVAGKTGRTVGDELHRRLVAVEEYGIGQASTTVGVNQGRVD